MTEIPSNKSDLGFANKISSGPPSRTQVTQPQIARHKLDEHMGGTRKDYTTSQLCTKCRHVFDSWPSMLQAISGVDQCVEYAHWDNINLFEEAVSKGCHLCIHFFAQFSENDIENAHRALGEGVIDRLYFTVMSNSARGIADVCNWKLTLSLPLLEGLQLVYMGMTPAAKISAAVQELASSTRDASCLQQAKGWLAGCHNTHNRCGPTKVQYPTRLIAVDQDVPRLVLSTELSGTGRYVTLSHCWGTLNILRLVKSNFQSFRIGIPWEELSQTFQDACFVAKEFGFQYIWIDSLCIIQDDAEDWATESVLMSSVYGCSSLNIAASQAKDGSEGLFVSRNPKSVEKIQLCLQSGTVKEGLTAMASANGCCPGVMYDCAPIDIWKNNVSHSVLGKRAWVLQERILSPRTLFFSTQLLWTCGSLTACETFTENPPEGFIPLDEDYRVLNSSEHWAAILWLYTQCKLTFKKDRLIALSGIAQMVQQRYDDEYFAGLWKKDLHQLLQWRFRDGTGVRQGKRPHPGPPFSAPSWSWAAVDGAIYHLPNPSRAKRILFEIVGVDIEPRRESRYGDVSSGTLRLRCQYLVPFSLPESSKPDKDLRVSSPANCRVLVGGQEIPDVIYFTWDFTERSGTQLYLLFADESEDSAGRSMHGFVLESIDPHARTYRRVAMFDIYRMHRADWIIELASAGIHLSEKNTLAGNIGSDKKGIEDQIICIV